MEKEEFYVKQIQGLMLIMKQSDGDKDFMISRNYVFEKLNMILNGGIGFHPSIEEKLK